MTKFFLAIHFIFLIIFTKSKADICDECETAIYIPYETQPVREIQLLVNQTLAVQCRISTVTHECDSSYLFFHLFNKNEFSRDVKIVDNSTIELYMQDVPQMSDLFTCQYVNKALKKVCGLSQIGVRAGYQPKITNFSCISVDLEMMKCTIEQIRNPLTNNFTIIYGPSSDGTHIIRTSSHPVDPTNESKISFYVTGFANVWDYYYFQIVVKNDFGITNETYWVDVKRGAFKPVIQSLSVTPTIFKSAILYWAIPSKYAALHKIKQFKHNISISRKSEVSSENLWRKIDANNTKEINETTFELKIDLDYAYTEYVVQISTCVQGALYEYLWSDPKHYTFQTLKQNPDSPPEVALGGFEILSNSETKIHWKEIPKAEWNADYINVEIVEVMENGTSVEHFHQPDYYSTTAKFHGLQHATIDYQFKIISINSEGPSNKYSVINIPREVRRIAYPNNLKKVLSNSVYTLTWEWDSSQSYTPDNYTIFVCDPIDEQEDLCGKLLDFAYVNFNAGNTFIYNNTHDGKPKKIFAISSNRNDQTSGMVWFPCTNTEYQEMTKFPVQLQVLGPYRMNVTWNTQCAALHTGINISYCPIYNESVTECDETALYAPENLNFHVIENLEAYTTYRVRISMFKGNKSGPPISLNTTTKSSKPTVPYDLSYTKKSNTSITITWKPPNNWNGQEKSYKIYYKLINSTNYQYVENKRNGIYLPSTFQLGNLLSYSTYTIQIAACNTDWCSNTSNEITIKTDVGKPDKIDGFNNETASGYYAWYPPQYKAGKIDFYEIKFEARNKDPDSKYKVIKKIFINSTECTLGKQKALCQTNTDSVRISVRPINIVPLDGEVNDVCCTDETENSNYNEFDPLKCAEEMHYWIKFDCSAHHNCLAGDWFSHDVNCITASNVMATIIIASFCIGLGMLIGLSMVCKKFQEIKDVGDPELPSGMENLLGKKKPLHRNELMHNKPSSTYMDNGYFIGEINYSSNSDNIAENILSSKQSITNLLNLTQSIIPYEYEIEAEPILNYTHSSNTSNYEYDGESLNHSETISYDSTQSMNDSRMFSVLTETTNTESDGVTQTAAPCPLITSNGYVQVRDIPPPKAPIFFASTGYVCISDLPNQNVNVINNSKLMERNILWPVNGYVKPQHLAGFECNRGAI